MSDDVTGLEDEVKAYADGPVARVRVLSVPISERFDEGLKYAYHYGVAGASDPIIRFDNHHGPHEFHLGETTYEIDFPGLATLYRVGELHSRGRCELTGNY